MTLANRTSVVIIFKAMWTIDVTIDRVTFMALAHRTSIAVILETMRTY
jgi:multidrug efflux pump subunit AcrB